MEGSGAVAVAVGSSGGGERRGEHTNFLMRKRVGSRELSFLLRHLACQAQYGHESKWQQSED